MGSAKVPGDAREAELIRMMQTYGGMLVGICTGMLGDAHLAQDVTQETFIRAYYKMDSFRGEREGSEKAWLARIAVNLCRDALRSKWFRFVDRKVTPDVAPLSCEATQEAQCLFEAVQKLPGKYREVILLHYYQDMPAAEIAQALRLNPASVYRRLEKARQKLKQLIERGETDER